MIHRRLTWIGVGLIIALGLVLIVNPEMQHPYTNMMFALCAVVYLLFVRCLEKNDYSSTKLLMGACAVSIAAGGVFMWLM